MKNLDPYLRQIIIMDYLPNKDFVMAYDCRFFFVLSGKGELITKDRSFPLNENTLAYYPCGIPYLLRSGSDDPLSFVTVNFDFTKSYPERTTTLRPVKVQDYSIELERTTQKEISETRFEGAFTVEHAFFLRNDFLELYNVFKNSDTYKSEISSALLKYIILKLATHLQSNNRENRIVSRVMDYVNTHSAEMLDNHTIATHFGYHPYYLSSLFKLHTGRSLHQYVLEARLKLAADMLSHTNMSINEIALKCGFQNANHFSVRFKDRYKESPTLWRSLNSII